MTYFQYHLSSCEFYYQYKALLISRFSMKSHRDIKQYNDTRMKIHFHLCYCLMYQNEISYEHILTLLKLKSHKPNTILKTKTSYRVYKNNVCMADITIYESDLHKDISCYSYNKDLKRIDRIYTYITSIDKENRYE